MGIYHNNRREFLENWWPNGSKHSTNKPKTLGVKISKVYTRQFAIILNNIQWGESYGRQKNLGRPKSRIAQKPRWEEDKRLV